MTYTDAVVYANPREVLGWEHDNTYDALVDVAKEERWEELNIPPAEVVYFPNGVSERLSNVHYVIVNGHHRHNAAKEAGKPFPVLPIDVGEDGMERYASLARVGGYDPERNTYTPMDPKVPEWNADGTLTTHYLKETTEVKTPTDWTPWFKINALRGAQVLDGTVDELLRDPAYTLDSHQVDALKFQLGSKTYDHAKSSESTSYDYFTVAYAGGKEHPGSYEELLVDGEIRFSGLDDERTYKLSEVRDTPVRKLLKANRNDTVHEVTLAIDVDTY